MNQKVRSGEELNLAKLRKYLKQNNLIDSEQSEIQIIQFQTGFSNLTYSLNTEEKEFVLRRPPFGAIKRGHDMGREFKVLSGLNKGFNKAPKVYSYSEDADVLGAPFYIMEKIEGIILSRKEADQRKVSEGEFKQIGKSWLGAFVELHQLDYESLGLGDLGKPTGYVERQIKNWSNQYLKATTEEISVSSKVMDWLKNNMPKEYGHSLIHNDYKYDNVVFSENDWTEVKAILDWEMCTLGDPMMDLGTSLAYWSIETDSDLILNGWPSPTALPGNPGRTKLVEMYEKLSKKPVDHLTFYYAYGLFKIAVIVQQIYYRYHHGMTTDKRFAHLNQATLLFFTIAWQAIQKNKIEDLF